MVTITRSLIADLHVTAYASKLCLAQWHRLASRAAILRIQSSIVTCLPALHPSSYASVVAFAVCQGSTSHVYLLLTYIGNLHRQPASSRHVVPSGGVRLLMLGDSYI